MRKLVFGLSLLLGACSGGGKLAELAAKLGIGGAAKDCSSAVAAEAATPPKAAADEATTKAPAVLPEQGLAKAPDVLPPPTTAEGRRLARMAVTTQMASSAKAEPAEAAADSSEAAPAPAAPRHHRKAEAEAVPVAVSRKTPARVIDNHDHFSESTEPSEYRLPGGAEVLVPREGETVLNGPRHEGVAPPNSNPVRISQN